MIIRYKTCIGIIIIFTLAAGCNTTGPSSPVREATSIPATETLIPPSATLIPPTDTPIPPTETSSPTRTDTAIPNPTDTPTQLPPISGSGGGVIAFSSERDGNAEIYVMNADGSAQQRLTDHPADDFHPSWSPDGSQIVFYSHRTGNADIFVMNADGSNLRQLTDNAASDYYPHWSPDGAKIVFDSDRDGNQEIYIMQADGSNLQRLTNTQGGEYFPAWSPDGTQIAFISDRDGNQEIYVMEADGSNQRRLTKTPNASELEPEWSPDGTQIAFISDRTGDRLEVYLMNADGSDPIQLTVNHSSENHHSPGFSPDGKQIVFAAKRDLYLFNITDALRNAGNNAWTRLTDDATNYEHFSTWRPASQTIETVTDVDGNVYPVIQIGDQWWMATNLNVTSDPTGRPIAGYCYDDAEENCTVYGRLYTWSTAMNGSRKKRAPGICPAGWHIPSDAEWQVLINYLGGESVAGGKLKAAGTLHWLSPNTGATDEIGFNALPAGFFDFTGEFRGLGEACFYRTSSAQDAYEVYIRELSHANAAIPRGGIHPDDAIPVRCVKD